MIKLAVVGTGGMANNHAIHFKQIADCELVAACDLSESQVTAFAEKHNIPNAFTDLNTLLQSSDINAITNVTPDRFHAPISIKALDAGKHVLCEKPLAENFQDASAMVAAAKASGKVNMVNFSYRDAPAIQKAAQLIQDGAIGQIRHVEASYKQSWLSSHGWGNWRESPKWLWRLSTSHGSKGVLGDVGVHILDFASFPVGDIARLSCRLNTFSKADNDKIGEYLLDANDSAIISVEFANGALGSITTTRWATGHMNSLTLSIHGDTGALRIDLDKSRNTLDICSGEAIHKSVWETIYCGETLNIYERFIKSIQNGTQEQPDFARGAAIQKALDRCVESDSAGQWLDL